MLKKYANKLKCLEEDIEIYGNYDTSVFANLMIVFEKCDRTIRTCKSEAAITEWLEYKYIFTVTNSKKFVQHEFDDKRVFAHSETKWFPISNANRNEEVRMLMRQELNLNDYHWNVGDLRVDN